MTEEYCRKQALAQPTESELQENESNKYMGKLRQVASVTEEREGGSNAEWKKLRDKTQQEQKDHQVCKDKAVT